MKIYILSGRYGVEMETPSAYATENEAVTALKDIISEIFADKISEDEDLGPEFDADGMRDKDVDAIIQWGVDHDVINYYGTNDIAIMLGDDWSEYMVTETDFTPV